MSAPRSWAELARRSPAELRELQDAALRRFVREELYPFSARYRRVLDEAGVAPGSIRGVDDLRRLPFTTKQDLLEAQSDPERKRDFVLVPTPERIRRHWPFGRKLALVLGGQRARRSLARAYTPNFVTFTTGRSSEPVVFLYTPHDLDVLAEATARVFDLLEVDTPELRLINMMPFAPHLAFWAVTLGGFRTGRMVFPSGGGKVLGTEGNLRVMQRMGATALTGTPGYVYHVLRQAAEGGADLSAVHTIVLGAEKVTAGLKAKMRELLASCGAHDVAIAGTYGFTEARMAFSECRPGADHDVGYHVYPDLGVFELIDPESGEPVGEGEDGELVYTGVSGHGTVVVRYRSGELCVGGLRRDPCPHCGRGVPRISPELRRVSDRHALNLTKIKGTLVDLSHIGSVLSGLRDVDEWQVVLRKEDDDPYGLDQFEVRFAARDGVAHDDLERRIRREISTATEVAPNRVTAHTRAEMVELLGMETEMKEKRFLDERPR